jgi:hypothetical protein
MRLMTVAKNGKKGVLRFRVRCLQPLSHPSNSFNLNNLRLLHRSPFRPFQPALHEEKSIARFQWWKAALDSKGAAFAASL